MPSLQEIGDFYSVLRTEPVPDLIRESAIHAPIPLPALPKDPRLVHACNCSETSKGLVNAAAKENDPWNTSSTTAGKAWPAPVIAGMLGYVFLMGCLRHSDQFILSKMNAFDVIVTVSLG